MGIRPRVSALVSALALAACSSAIPTSEPPDPHQAVSDVRAPLGRAPGSCDQVSEFEYVAVTTLRALGFDELRDDPDYERRGRFWVTAERLEIPMPSGAPDRPPMRMLCVEWADGNPIGFVEQGLPDEWSPPSD